MRWAKNDFASAIEFSICLRVSKSMKKMRVKPMRILVVEDGGKMPPSLSKVWKKRASRWTVPIMATRRFIRRCPSPMTQRSWISCWRSLRLQRDRAAPQAKILTPVLILSAKRSVDDRVKGLQTGGDDYLTKPYSFAELLAACRRPFAGPDTKPSRLGSLPATCLSTCSPARSSAAKPNRFTAARVRPARISHAQCR